MLAVMVWYPRATVARSNDTSSTSSLFGSTTTKAAGTPLVSQVSVPEEVL